jgi:hypothetical protein
LRFVAPWKRGRTGFRRCKVSIQANGDTNLTESGGDVFHFRQKTGKIDFSFRRRFCKIEAGKIYFKKKLYIYSQNSNPKFFQQGKSCDSLASLDLKSLLGMSMLRMKNYQGRPDSL